MSINSKNLGSLLTLGLLLLVPATRADLSDISNVIFRIEATNATGTGFVEFTKDPLTYNPVTDTYHWNTGTQVIEDAFFNPIATLQNANLALQMNATKKIAGAFAVQAGDSNTTFRLSMAQISFDTLPASQTMAAAGISANVTDTTGNGVAMQAIAPATGILLTDYNGMVPSGTLFVQLLQQLSAPFGSTSTLVSVPYTALSAPVSDMNSQVAFTLTAGDLGGGTHYFQIIPEPTGLGLLLASVLWLVRRR